MKVISFYVALACAVSLCLANTCPPCETVRCAEPRCDGPVATDLCGCCQTCAKAEHEVCATGLTPSAQGICQEGLYCAHRKNDGGILPFESAIENPIIGEMFRRLPQLNFTCMTGKITFPCISSNFENNRASTVY